MSNPLTAVGGVGEQPAQNTQAIIYGAGGAEKESVNTVEGAAKPDDGSAANGGNDSASSGAGANGEYRIRPASELARQTAEVAASAAEKFGPPPEPESGEDAARGRAESAMAEARFQALVERVSERPEAMDIDGMDRGPAASGEEGAADAPVQDSPPTRAFQDNLGAVRGGAPAGERVDGAA